MKKPSSVTRGLIIFVSLLLLISNGRAVLASHETKTVDPAPLLLVDSPQVADAGLPNLKFHLLAPEVGWLATEKQLYWTETSGRDWQDITPKGLNLPIAKVEFLDEKIGWLIGLDPSKEPASIQIFQTNNGGGNWQDNSSSLQEAINTIDHPLSSEIYSQLDADGQGWVLFKLATGVNFSLGELLYTPDDGNTWQRRETQSGDSFVFIDAQFGYQLAAHASGLLCTQDGGMSWQAVDISLPGLETSDVLIPGLPAVAEDGGLVMPVYAYSDEQLAKTYVLTSVDRGQSWTEAKAALESNPEVLRGEPVLQTVSNSGELTQWQRVVFAPAKGSQPNSTSNLGGLDQLALTHIASPDGNSGWGLFTGGGCLSAADELTKTCTRAQVLASTMDGGSTWSLLSLPAEVAVAVESQFASTDQPSASISSTLLDETTLPNTTNWQVISAHGFDTCAAVSMSRMATWRASSPYTVYGLYIGGSMAYCPNTVFNATSLRLLFNAGWRFIPTWVGPQAPCADFKYTFSLDPAKAYNEGVANANEAVEALKTRGMTNPDGSGSVIYYDLERFPYNVACQTAVRSFLKGWTTRLHQTGNKAGLYATSTNINVNQIYNIDPVVDVVWIAEWYSVPEFRDWVTVFHVDYLSDGYWSKRQRVYQYSGGHYETWGGLTLGIDNNVIDGVVGVPYSSDIILPISKVSLTGTLVSGVLYKSTVKVTLSATDNVSGINAIYYKLNNGDWTKYTAPFDVSESQAHTLQYRAVDGVYNWEDPKQTTFEIDVAPPGYPTALKSVCPYPGLTQPFCNDEAFSWTTAVDSQSGLDRTYIYWGTNPNGTSTTLATTSFNPAPIADQTRYYLRFQTVDKLGNTSAWRTLYVLSYDKRFTNFTFMPAIWR